MALKNYGVLKGRIVAFEGERTDRKSPHLQITVDADGKRFRAAVNVKSAEQPSELVYFERGDYAHPQLARYSDFSAGLTPLEPHAGSGALDYIRGNLFDFADVEALPHDAPGRDDDLLDKLELHLKRAIGLGSAVDAYIFGEPFPDGIHDVHMNQGSIGRFAGSNGVWQDGGLLLHDRVGSRWTALFLAFQSQAIHTDDRTGHALAGSARFADLVAGRAPGEPAPSPAPEPSDPSVPSVPASASGAAIRIVAALVNPIGPEDRTGGETVTLLNPGASAVNVAGWTLATSAHSRLVLTDTAIGAGEAVRIDVRQPLALSNQGGIISLLDDEGSKVHGVSYTRAQAASVGLTVVF